MQSTRTSRLLWLAAAFAAMTALSAPDIAQAQRRGRVDIGTPHTGGRPFQLDIHAGFTWWGLGAATGVRFGIPLMNNGFVPSINNAVYLNFGADFYWVRRHCGGCGGDDYGAGVGFPVAMHWEFYFNENWSAFFEIGFQIFLHPRLFQDDRRWDVYDGGYWFLAAAGGSFHINEWFLLTLRVGIPYVSFGITFQFG